MFTSSDRSENGGVHKTSCWAPLREAKHKGLLSCALLHKTEDRAPAPTQTARETRGVESGGSPDT